MRCLILSMFCNLEFFINEEKINRITWAGDVISKKYENLEYWAYTASQDGKYHVNKNSHIIKIPCNDNLEGTADKTFKCFELLKQLGYLENIDFIYRTNTSTYINVALLNSFLNTDQINENLIYGASIYITRSYVGPFNYVYSPVGNSMMFHKKYINILNMSTYNEYINKGYGNYVYYRDGQEPQYKTDDQMIGFLLNCYFEFELKKYHKLFYRQFGMNNIINGDPNLFIATTVRIYDESISRNLEFEYIKKIHSIINVNNNTIEKGLENINYNMLYSKNQLCDW